VLVEQTSHYPEFVLHLDSSFEGQSSLLLQATHLGPGIEHFGN